MIRLLNICSILKKKVDGLLVGFLDKVRCCYTAEPFKVDIGQVVFLNIGTQNNEGKSVFVLRLKYLEMGVSSAINYNVEK